MRAVRRMSGPMPDARLMLVFTALRAASHYISVLHLIISDGFSRRAFA